ncbi:hypothetical protein N7540_000215 [Penicillium herquei]|nr:hypothetical protein N7540_000215 [Penicillium herquei]
MNTTMSDHGLKRSKLRAFFHREGKDKGKGKQPDSLAIHNSLDNGVSTAPAGDTGTASASATQQAPEPVSRAQVPQEPPNNQSPEQSSKLKPYTENYVMWDEALQSLEEEERCSVNTLLKGWDSNHPKRADLVQEIQKKMDGALKNKHHDRTTSIGKLLSLLDRFLSAVDVAVSFDPIHAALPWAAVRCVIVIFTAHNQLKGVVLAGMAEVTSLLVRCDMYQLLYMAPKLSLRPPEHVLAKLKICIVQSYAGLQSFLAFVKHQQSSLKIGDVFKLDDARAHIDKLAGSQKQLLQAADDCEKHCNQSNRSDLKELLGLSSEIPIVRQQMDLVLERIDATDERELLNWISPIPYGIHHSVIVESRTLKTCEWLLQNKNFCKWMDYGSSPILWLKGSMGAGKTYLTSKVIDHVQSLLESSLDHAGFAFFYCNRNEENRRDPLCILQSFVRQLSTPVGGTEHIRKKLKIVSHQAQRQGSHLGFGDCITQLTESINEYSETFIILDALDECNEDSRWRLIHVIKELVSKSDRPLKVFISSRPNDEDIKTQISGNNIEIQAVNNQPDIEKFVNAEIDKPRRWGPITADLRIKIVQVLCKDSKGMFQWAYLQIKQVLELSTSADIEIRLGKLPKTLKAAYEEIYGEIAKSPHRKALVNRACKWVMSACTPFSSDELLSAIHIDADESPMSSDKQLNESELLDLCSNLLVIDSKTRFWRFSHLSVREYFERGNHWGLCEAHSYVAKVCLKLLIQTYDNPTDESGMEISDHIHNFENPDKPSFDPQLKTYVQHHWMLHVKAYEEIIIKERQTADLFLANLLKRFLGSPSKSSPQYRAWFHSLGYIQWDYPQSSFFRYISKEHIGPENVTICAICSFSFYVLLQDWWDNGEITISQKNNRGNTTLQLAAQAGCKPICEALVKRFTAKPFALLGDFCDGALVFAAHGGSTEIINILLDYGADVNLLLLRGRYGSALAAAAHRGSIEILNVLIENGADVNLILSSGYYGSALAAAAHRGSKEIVNILIENGADVNLLLISGRYGSALAAAAHRGSIEIVNTLIENGADVNLLLSSVFYGSALAAAAYGGSIEIVKILIDKGADVNLILLSGDYGSALAAAAGSFSERTEIVKILIGNGADGNLTLPVGKYETALAAAVSKGYKEVEKVLVDNGATKKLVC